MTKFHSKYFAHELTRAGGKDVDRIGRALFDTCLEMNPHQIEAAAKEMDDTKRTEQKTETLFTIRWDVR